MVSRLGTLFVLRKDTGEEYTQFPITKRLNTFGRHLSCDVRLYDELISRQHARLEIDDSGNAFLENLSVNGTFVNDKELSDSENKRFRLNTGDIISLAGHRFRWEYPVDEKQDDQVVIYTPKSKTHISTRSIKQSPLLSINKDIVNVPYSSEKRMSSVTKKSQDDQQTSIKVKTPKNILTKTKEISGIPNSGSKSGIFPLKRTFRSKTLTSSTQCLKKHCSSFCNISGSGVKKVLFKDMSDSLQCNFGNNIDFFPKENIRVLEDKVDDHFAENKAFNSATKYIADQNIQITDGSKYDSKLASTSTNESLTNLVSTEQFERKFQSFGIAPDSVLAKKDINFLKNKEPGKKDSCNFLLEEKKLEYEKDDSVVFPRLTHSLLENFPEKKTETFNNNNCSYSRSFGIEENMVFSPPREKSCSILPDIQPSPLKQGSPILHLVKKKYTNTRDLPPRFEESVTRNKCKKRQSFPLFAPSKLLNNPTLSNLRFRRSISDSSLPSSTYITKVKHVAKKQKDFPVTPPEFLEILNDSEKRLLGLVPSFSSDVKKNDSDSSEMLESSVLPKNNVIYDTILSNSNKEKCYNNSLNSNCNNSGAVFSEFKTFSPGKWAVTFNGKKQKLYESPIRSVNENILFDNFSVDNIDSLNQCFSSNKLKDIDKIFSPGKWAFTAPGKKIRLYCSPDIRVKSTDKLVCDSCRSKSSIGTSSGFFFNSSNLNGSNSGINNFESSYVNYASKNQNQADSIPFDLSIDKSENSSNVLISLNNRKGDLYFNGNLGIDMDKINQDDIVLPKTVTNNINCKKVLINNLDDAQKMYINNSLNMGELGVGFMNKNVMDFNMRFVNGQLLNFGKLFDFVTNLKLSPKIIRKLSSKYSLIDNDFVLKLLRHYALKKVKINHSLFQNDIQRSQSINAKLITWNHDYNQRDLMDKYSLCSYKKVNSPGNVNTLKMKFKNSDYKSNNLFIYDQQIKDAVTKSPNDVLNVQSMHICAANDENLSCENICSTGNSNVFPVSQERSELEDAEKETCFFENVKIKEIGPFLLDETANEFDVSSKEGDNSVSEIHTFLEPNSTVFQVDQFSPPKDINSSFIRTKRNMINKETCDSQTQKQNIKNGLVSLKKSSINANIRKKNVKESSESAKKIPESKPLRMSNRLKERSINISNNNVDTYLFKNNVSEMEKPQEKVHHSNFRVTRSSIKTKYIDDNKGLVKLTKRIKSSKNEKNISLDNDLFVDTSKKTKINSLEKCTRITRSSVLLSKNSKSETQLDLNRIKNF
ncbi:hypothetical protein PORY_002080 [Pneumocystis oryctolagi]|uniref:Uncharacterized protein n=1 Tax=Pneumocystis oryctolagi TaxID=42067 RepID=A0ACB7CA82_9ASCO|nr:hypothetical protein PORY_002080 [Pneumocystis oryctolagi]